MNDQQLESLLYEEESTTLDFKQEQYRFQGEDDDVKSEFLKDVLAFANSWRRSDAYILIGIAEVKGGRSRVLGVRTHLNDNELQQFVNSKTQRPAEFSYRALTFESKQVGIVHIPVQGRPLYLARDYGRLRREAVYIRRGSATAEADPDEIARMGAWSPLVAETPELELELAAPEKRIVLGDSAAVKSVLLTTPPMSTIPDYRTGVSSFVIESGTNVDYHRELAVYLRDWSRIEPLRLAVKNVGGTTARDVRAELYVADPRSQLYACDEFDIPTAPARNTILSRQFEKTPFNCDVTVEHVLDGWRILAEFGKCQPKQKIITGSSLFLGAKLSGEIVLQSQLFSDELPDPLETALTVHVSTEERELSLDELLKM